MVRATFAGMSTALSALQANQKRLDIVGQNLTNMNTVGYTRQQLETSSLNYTTPVSNYMNGSEIIVGFGVRMDKVSQIRDPYLDIQYRNQMQKSGYTDSLQTSLDRLARIFDESDINGIRDAFDDIQATLINMQDSPKVNVPIYETELRTRMQALTNLLNDSARQVTEAERMEYINLNGQHTTENGAVETVNNILMQIGTLNRQIKQNQILGQQSLELMDERNVLLDELSSYIPIEVTYYKDLAHDGVDADGNTDTAAARSEVYHLDSNGQAMFKKEWPDDLRVEMVYTAADGSTKRITLIEGTEGTKDNNYGKLTLDPDTITDPDNPPYPDGFTLTFTACAGDLKNGGAGVELNADDMRDNGVQLTDGSIQASLDMLWKTGTQVDNDRIRGYEYYMKQLDTLAEAFANVMNTINIAGAQNAEGVDAATQFLLVNKTDNSTGSIKAANIGINTNWGNGKVQVSSAGDNPNDTVLYMLEAMGATYPYSSSTSKLDDILAGINPNLNSNSFADFMNNVSTTLANDSYSNTIALKTNVTVLNAIENSRDSMSGVSLDEEASNMMMYQAAYQAASRLMTALDQVLDVLINSTGTCGR